jgi:LPXTG-site transpeptidase (sortase) family protein
MHHAISKPKQYGRSLVMPMMILLVFVMGISPAYAANPVADLNQVQNGYENAMLPVLAQASNTEPLRLGAFQQSNLVAPNARALDEFGWSVAISGNTAVVGARNADPDLGGGPVVNAGAAYVYVRSGTSWIEEARLTARDAQAGDSLGVSVAIDRNTIVVGATGCDINNEEDAGAAYVFVRTGITWSQKTKLVAADADNGDNFGSSVGIAGSTIVVGADSKDLGGYLVDSGEAYVFINRSNAWDQKAKLIPSDPDVGDYFGTSVAVDSGRIVVGATEANFTGMRGTGKAYVFSGGGNTWAQEVELSADDSRSGDYFGNSVAISGRTVVVGAVFADPDLGAGRLTNAGEAYVFSGGTGEWIQQATLVSDRATPFGQFGQSVAINADRVVVGANGESQSGYSAAGAAYVYKRSGKVWTQQTRIIADAIYDNDDFGEAVSISGDYVLVGATGRDPNLLADAGEAFVYRLALVQLPEAGFAPGKVTPLSVQPLAKAYQSLGNLWLEIPDINVQTPIVSIPQGGEGWDLTWLWDQAGYLEGTAFPTWNGNTGIAGHVYLPNGEQGPFANLGQLRWGDAIYIHAWGQRYHYEVRSSARVRPDKLDVLSHTDRDWITLITCEDYDQRTDQFRTRLVVKAVLLDFDADP